MPRFHKNRKPIKKRTKRRTFSQSRKDSQTTAKQVVPKADSSGEKAERIVEESPEKAQLPGETELMSTQADVDTSTQVDEINRMIATASKRLHELVVEPDEPLPVTEEPQVYDGISSDEERFRLMEEKLTNEQRRSARLEHEIQLIQAEFEEEKRNLEKRIRGLQQDMSRVNPLEDSKIFSLSNELKGAIDAIETLTDKTRLPESQEETLDLADEDVSDEDQEKQDTPIRVVTKPIQEKVKPQKSEADPIKKGTPKKKKLLITGASAVAVLLIISGGVSLTLFSKPTVNEELVNEYLNKQPGEVAGTTSDNSTEPPDGTQTTPQIVLSPADEVINREVTFEETQWEEFYDPLFGVKMQYPTNTVKLVKTDSSATFSRRDGYIFRVQLIETGLDLQVYWDQVKATNYDYAVKEVEFKSYKALHLTLQEEADYPGNKYLVKVDDTIYDVWYATESKKFSADDIKRVDHMIRNIDFLKKS